MLVVAALVLVALIAPLVAIVTLLILAPMRTLIATEATFQFPLDIGQLTLLAALFIWVIHTLALSHRLPRLRWPSITVPILLFVIIIGLTAFAARSLSLWLNEWLKWVQVIILLLIVYAGFRRNWKWLLAGLLLSGAANALIGIYQFFGGSGADHLLINQRFFRAFGTFGQPNPFGGFMGLLLPLAVAAALGFALHWWKTRATSTIFSGFMAASTAGVMAAALIMSWSRGAWLGTAAAFGVMALALPRRKLHGLALLAAGTAILGLLWWADLLPSAIVERVSSATAELFSFSDVRGVDITSDNYAVVERLSHWQAALNMARANPWLGVGMGNYEYAYAQYRLLNWPEPLGHAHNFYLNMLAEGGLLGLIGYGKVWLLIFLVTWRARRHPDTFLRLIAVGLLGSWTYLSVHSLFDNLYVNNVFLHIGVMLGITAIIHDDTQRINTLRSI